MLFEDEPPAPAEPVPLKLTWSEPVMLLLVSEMPRLDDPLPPALLALFERPTKLMTPPVMVDVPASPRNMMPMA